MIKTWIGFFLLHRHQVSLQIAQHKVVHVADLSIDSYVKFSLKNLDKCSSIRTNRHFPLRMHQTTKEGEGNRRRRRPPEQNKPPT